MDPQNKQMKLKETFKFNHNSAAVCDTCISSFNYFKLIFSETSVIKSILYLISKAKS